MKIGAASLVRAVNETRRPLVITQHGQARAVLMDLTTYEELKESLLMLRLLARGEADVRAGRTVPVRAAFRRVRREIRPKR
ncbi:MAG TPA: type II toxin-antitoxin system Phd/YefM family antitoxin [Myxococcaceae bacterium]|nr:type II toxin-antitoxin system Phd/YefM family antitoxin [Myxococcaceae bacterium]